MGHPTMLKGETMDPKVLLGPYFGHVMTLNFDLLTSKFISSALPHYMIHS